jgi:hypothetical protein
MDIMKYIGFKLDEVLEVLERENIVYKIIETYDTKGTKLGNEIRILNIKKSEVVQLYVAYF